MQGEKKLQWDCTDRKEREATHQLVLQRNEDARGRDDSDNVVVGGAVEELGGEQVRGVVGVLVE